MPSGSLLLTLTQGSMTEKQKNYFLACYFLICISSINEKTALMKLTKTVFC
jgi:hypothetical protein